MPNRETKSAGTIAAQFIAALLLWCCGSVAGAAVVNHSGTISVDETWAAADQHIVNGSVTVASGVTLTIEAGAIINQTPLPERKNTKPALLISPASTRKTMGLPRRPPTRLAVSSSGERWTW